MFRYLVIYYMYQGAKFGGEFVFPSYLLNLPGVINSEMKELQYQVTESWNQISYQVQTPHILTMLCQAALKPCEKGRKAFDGKVAIVTGSTYGIGFAMAHRLAQDGAHVLLCSRKRENVERVSAQLKEERLSISALQCHVGNKADRERLVATGIIGFAMARRLAQDGAHVLLCSRKHENVERVSAQLKEEGLSISAIQCHVGNKEDRERLVATAIEIYGKIDILICNAAVNPFVGPIFDTTEEMWEKVFHVNVISTFLLIKLVAPHMQKQGGGSIIICSSFIGYIPHPYIGPYSITKTALLGLTNIMAQSLRSMNIRVNGLALGLIDTSFSNVIKKTPELASKLVPLGVIRPGKPEECTGIASFLCSEDASYINGENIAVTGGIRGRL